MRKKDFLNGLVQGIPIALGYLSVSFGFGIMAVRAGLSVTDASLISLLNVTSAGQAAGVDIIASNGTIIEMILVQLTINIRYALMALSLSQKLDSSFTFPKRLIAAYGITDEIFGLCIAQKGRLRPFIMYGIIFISVLGWVLGTFLGAAAGEILPKSYYDCTRHNTLRNVHSYNNSAVTQVKKRAFRRYTCCNLQYLVQIPASNDLIGIQRNYLCNSFFGNKRNSISKGGR